MSIAEAQRQALLEARARVMGLQPWQLEAAEAVPTSLIQDLVADARRSSPVAPSSPAAPVQRGGSGWVEPMSMGPPPGQRWVDAQLDAADRADKLDRLREEMARRETLAALSKPATEPAPNTEASDGQRTERKT
jgi:hypothetical protein